MKTASSLDTHFAGPSHYRSLMIWAALLALGPSVAWASFQSLAERLPPATNALVAIDVEKVLNSPLATQEQWRQDMQSRWDKQPLMIPPGSARVLTAAWVKMPAMDSVWEMSLIEMDKVPTAEELAKAEGGYVDKVWDKIAACSPINAYFVPMDGKTLASLTPADRTEIVRWVRQAPKPGGNATSPYIQEVVSTLGEKTDILMAMDLEAAFGLPNIRRFLANTEIPELPKNQHDDVAAILSTLKGLTLDIKVDKDIRGKLTLHLDRDTDRLRLSANPLTLEVLRAAGMRLDDLKDWNFAVSGKQVRAEGKLSRPALRQLLSVVQSPIPAATSAPKAPPSGQPTTDPVVASQRYYKSICTMLDGISAAASAKDMAVWIRNTSRRIDQLPILNVDPALVEWGALVGTKLKQAGGVMGVAQTQINSRVAGVMDPDYGGSYYDSNGYYVNNYNSAAAENANRQRRQVALEQRGQAQAQALEIVNSVAATRPKIRAEMVAKYKVEF
jgi:hypothetical protein